LAISQGDSSSYSSGSSGHAAAGSVIFSSMASS